MKRILLAGLFVLLAAGCGGGGDEQQEEQTPVETGPTLAEILDEGRLIVATRNAPTMHYEGRFGPEGLEHDLITSFADQAGLDVEFVMAENVADLFAALDNGEAHVAAAGLTLTPERSERYLTGPVYETVRQQVVSRRGQKRPRNVEELVGREVGIVAESSYRDRLQELKAEHPELAWVEIDSVGTEELLHKVWRDELDLTVADDNIVSLNRRYFPELIVAFHLTAPESLVWYFHESADSLHASADDWFEAYRASGELEQRHEFYFGYLGQYDYVDTRKFINRIEDRLPKYRSMFEKVAGEFGLPWTVLAAISYQESHWNPRAKSPTGVRGMMMLTLTTAKEMGVDNRLDPEQSVRGGMKYLANMYSRLPADIKNPDRY
jgi:membrane-bound lytic murein transglycosylase F